MKKKELMNASALMPRIVRGSIFVLFVLISLFNTTNAQDIIKFTTNKEIGDEMWIDIILPQEDSPYEVTGLKKTGEKHDLQIGQKYIVTAKEITISSEIILGFNCYDSQVTDIDVSKCNHLQELMCNNNELTNINVRDCKALKKLNLAQNKVKILNLSGCDRLEWLGCWRNQIESINLDGCKSLSWLGTWRNKLTVLDFSDCENLESLDVENNNFTEISIDNLKKLKEVKCSFNKIAELNPTNCSSLEFIDCRHCGLNDFSISNCPRIKYIYIDNNNLTKLDLESLSTLEQLDCNTNKLTSVSLKNLKNIQWIEISKNELKEIDLSEVPNLRQLNVTENPLNSLDITTCVHLQGLMCQNSNLSLLDFTKSRSLINLNCSHNKLKNIDFSNCENLQQVNCSFNKLEALTFPESCNELTYLNCSSNMISKSSMQELFNSLPMNYEYWDPRKIIVKNLENSNEQNALPVGIVEIANNKYWNVYLKIGKVLYAYDGKKSTYKVESSVSDGGNVSLIGCTDLKNVPIGTKLKVATEENKGYVLITLKVNGVDIYDDKEFYVVGDSYIEAIFEKKENAYCSIKLLNNEHGTISIKGMTDDDLKHVRKSKQITVVAHPRNEFCGLEALYVNGNNIYPEVSFEIMKDTEVKAFFVDYKGELLPTDEVLGKDIDIIVNIFSKELSIKGARPNESFYIYNLQGQLCTKGKCGVDGNYTINISDLRKGLYIIIVGCKTEKIML
ncbi:leucine-rich repeat domain-containing protein [Falsiporphyromonas endometrii]|uniref:Leucine-rich repeat domain-containing protein n=1 Tax=Falsiporphyromonas endometrii TaxID=1387297 RepID=A0ABV9K571_9PORP